ncbi:MAG: 30S ribosomal protein S4e [Methanosarcinales archaeon]
MSRHQKRISAPKSWPMAKKTHKWVVKANPGPHSKKQSIPLLVVVRDLLKLGNNSREAKRILNEGNVLVDGIIRKDYKFPVGIFDVIAIPKIEKYYRVLLDKKGRITLLDIDNPNARKLCRINNKTIVKGGVVQLNLHDGTNIFGTPDYKTKDSILLSLPDKKIVKHLKYESGNLAVVIGGKHSGEIASIKEIKKTRSSQHNMVTLTTNTKDFETIEDYIFVIGETEPEINLGVATNGSEQGVQ